MRGGSPVHRPPAERPFGFVEWFRRGEYGRTERALEAMLRAGAAHLRTHLSWAEYHAPGGREWYDWLIPTLGTRIDLLPCVHYTPPSLSRTGRSSGPPERLRDYADFVDEVLTRYGAHFRAIELWNEPNNLLDWDWRVDPDYLLFCEMVGAAAYWAEQRGFRAVLAGPTPFDATWLTLMGERGVLRTVSAIGIHGFPGTWDSDEAAWPGWRAPVAEAQDILARFNDRAEVWITEAGYSTWRRDEVQQARRFIEAIEAPADRLYWYGWADIPGDVPVQEGLRFDPRHYHLGVVDDGERPKLLARALTRGGVAAARTLAELATPALIGAAHPIAIVGGAGFIGSNLARSFLDDGADVLVLDSLARPGVETNLDWLREAAPDRLHAVIADVRDYGAVEAALADAAAVFHFAAQVAVTTSLDDPLDDFSVNGQGTLHVLEAIRRTGRSVPLIFSSTNKVYGGLEDLKMIEADDRYVPADTAARLHGIGEDRPLDFCTPYGCSKGVADQYVLDYARTFGLPTAVLRMSCIYGPRQFGTEDQGWVAHFLLRALAGAPITIYGDGKQVRDILEVSDAVAAYRAVLSRIEALRGRAFNLGGGPANAVSLRILLSEIGRITGRRVEVTPGDWRKGDQLFFVADTRRLQAAAGWRPRVGWRAGVRGLAGWLGDNRLPRKAQGAEAQRLLA